MSLGGVPCPRCNTALPEGAVFCNLCGAQIQVGVVPRPVQPAMQPMQPMQPFGRQPAAPLSARPGFVGAGRGMAICHRCGIIAPTQRSTCSRCEAKIGNSLEAVPPSTDGTLWAEVRCTITCRQCGQLSPIDEPELDGTITCPQCNAIQAFDVSAWEEALGHAHAVVDLAGPSTDGRFPTPGVTLGQKNPYYAIGVTHTFSEIALSGMSIENGVMKTRNLKLAASPGHPLCKKCGCPVAAMPSGDALATRCPGCGDTATYGLDPRLAQMTPGLIGVAAEALRSDRREARLDQTSAGMVISLRCPQCGAGLSVLDGAHSVDCSHCKTSCRVPSRTLLALKKGQTEPAAWWVLFRGPSRKRVELERGDEEARDDGDEVAALAERVRAAQNAQKKSKLSALINPGGIEPAPAEEERSSQMLRWGIHIAVPLAMLALVALIGFWKVLGSWIQGRTSYEPAPIAVTPP